MDTAKRTRRREDWALMAVLDSALPPGVKLIAVQFLSHGDWETGGNIRPGIDRVADELGLSRRSVQRGLDALRNEFRVFVPVGATSERQDPKTGRVFVQPVGGRTPAEYRLDRNALPQRAPAEGCRERHPRGDSGVTPQAPADGQGRHPRDDIRGTRDDADVTPPVTKLSPDRSLIDQRTDQRSNGARVRSARVHRIIAAPSQQRRTSDHSHRRHVWCGHRAPCVPDFLHDDFLRGLGKSVPEPGVALKAWYDEIDGTLDERVPHNGDPREFWKPRFAQSVAGLNVQIARSR